MTQGQNDPRSRAKNHRNYGRFLSYSGVVSWCVGINLKEDRLVLTHGFWRFSPWLLGSVDSRSMASEYHGGRRQLFTSWWTGSREAGREP
jgi:hypothetical protein